MYFQPGNREKPGAISLTAIEGRSQDEVDRIVGHSRRIVQETAQLPGFISFVGATVGHRVMTMAAWEDAEKPVQLLRGGAHREAMQAFFGPDFAAGGITGVQVPHCINTMWVRCEWCCRMADALGATCKCGKLLPTAPCLLVMGGELQRSRGRGGATIRGTRAQTAIARGADRRLSGARSAY